MRGTTLVILVLLMVVFNVALGANLSNPVDFMHEVNKRKAECTDRCLQVKSRSEEKCIEVCAQIALEQVSAASDDRDEQVLADSFESKDDKSAADLWELYYDNFRKHFTRNSPGVQVLPQAIELTDIRSDIDGVEYMDAHSLANANAMDYDNPEILGRELIKVTTPGTFRKTNGKTIVNEYRKFLSGVSGTSSVKITSSTSKLADKRTAEFEKALADCYEAYYTSNPVVMMIYTEEAYLAKMCPRVKQTEQAMYAQLGVDHAKNTNRNAFNAAVFLGKSYNYSINTAIKKYRSLRVLELECIKAQSEGRAIKGTSRSMSFQYNHSSYKYHGESKSKSMSIGLGFISVGSAKQKMKMTGFDASSVKGVSIAFQDYLYIPLHIGEEWFSTVPLRDLRNAARVRNSPIQQFFGSSGSLSLIPKGLYVAVNPTISFEVASSQKNSLKTAAQKSFSIGLNIYGFSFGLGFGKGSSLEEGKDNGKTARVAFASRSCKPQLFAVDNFYFY